MVRRGFRLVPVFVLAEACAEAPEPAPDCGALGCEPTVLALEGQNINWPTLRVAGGSLFWSTRFGEVRRLEIETRAVTELAALTLDNGWADPEYPFTGLAALGDRVFFSFRGVAGVLAVPVTGGDVETLYPDMDPEFITTYQGQLLWITGGGAVYLGDPSDGSAVLINDLMDYFATPIAAGGGYVYGSTSYYGTWRLDLETQGGGIGKVDREQHDFLAVNELGVFFHTSAGLTYRPHADLDAVEVITTDPSRELVGTNVGVLWHNTKQDTVSHWEQATGEITEYRYNTIGQGPRALAADDAAFYWVDRVGGRIWAVGRPIE